MKILLVDPPFQRFMGFAKYYSPLGLLSLAGAWKSRGHEVLVYDADYNPGGTRMGFHEKMAAYDRYVDGVDDAGHAVWRAYGQLLDQFRPDAVGVTVITPKLLAARRAAGMARDRGFRVLLGGPHATISPGSLADWGAALIVRGEGDQVDPAIDGEVRSRRIDDLSTLPMPDRGSLVGVEHYRPDDLAVILTGRGCPHACAYCCSSHLWPRGVRMRGITDIMNEVDVLAAGWGAREFHIMDDTFGCARRPAMEFSREMGVRGLSWTALTRSDTLDRGLAATMRDGGCRMAKIGVESGSDAVLARMNKRERARDTSRVAEILRSVGLPWTAYIMVGFPGETTAEMALTRDLIERTRPDFISISIFTPYPGTAAAASLAADQPWEQFNHHRLRIGPWTVLTEGQVAVMVDWCDGYNAKKTEE